MKKIILTAAVCLGGAEVVQKELFNIPTVSACYRAIYTVRVCESVGCEG